MGMSNLTEDLILASPASFCGKHRLANGKMIFFAFADLPREGNPAPLKFSDGTVYAPSREEALLTFALVSRFEVIGLNGELDEVISKDADGTEFVRTSLRLSDDALSILDTLDFAAKRVGGIVLVHPRIVLLIREMEMRGRFSRVAAMDATPETRDADPRDAVVRADRWFVP